MQYNKLNQNDIDYFKSIIEEKRILLGKEIISDYSHDELSGVSNYPDMVIFVKSTKEVSEIMRYANNRTIPVVVRGSGTGLVGSCVAIHGGIMLVTTQMNRILQLDEKNLALTVEPGVLLLDIIKQTEENGFFYPPDPGEKTATIAGNINTNAGGMRAVKYGVTREYIRGITVVLPNGDIIKTGGKTVKNSSGYSIKDLIIGSEGTLGIVTEAVLKIIPLPECSVSLLVPFRNIDNALNAVKNIVTTGLQPTAIEYMEKETILYVEQYLGKSFPSKNFEAYILLIFDGNKAHTEYIVEKAAKLLLGLNAEDVYIVDTEERKNAVWSSRGAFLEAIKASTSDMDECDVVVPIEHVFEFVKYTKEISKQLNIRIPSFGHAGDGNLHVYVCRDKLPENEWKNLLKIAFDLMYAKANDLSGLVSGEHGIGYAKREYFLKTTDVSLINLMRGIKNVFDEKNILNPGKVI